MVFHFLKYNHFQLDTLLQIYCHLFRLYSLNHLNPLYLNLNSLTNHGIYYEKNELFMAYLNLVRILRYSSLFTVYLTLFLFLVNHFSIFLNRSQLISGECLIGFPYLGLLILLNCYQLGAYHLVLELWNNHLIHKLLCYDHL